MMTPAKTRLVTTLALGAVLVAASALSACGKLGTLEQAPPLFGRGAASSSSSSGPAVSKNANGGDTATLDGTNAKRETERAKPEKNARPKASDYYTNNTKVQDAPLEGFGNAARVDNNNPNK